MPLRARPSPRPLRSQAQPAQRNRVRPSAAGLHPTRREPPSRCPPRCVCDACLSACSSPLAAAILNWIGLSRLLKPAPAALQQESAPAPRSRAGKSRARRRRHRQSRRPHRLGRHRPPAAKCAPLAWLGCAPPPPPSHPEIPPCVKDSTSAEGGAVSLAGSQTPGRLDGLGCICADTALWVRQPPPFTMLCMTALTAARRRS